MWPGTHHIEASSRVTIWWIPRRVITAIIMQQVLLFDEDLSTLIFFFLFWPLGVCLGRGFTAKPPCHGRLHHMQTCKADALVRDAQFGLTGKCDFGLQSAVRAHTVRFQQPQCRREHLKNLHSVYQPVTERTRESNRDFNPTSFMVLRGCMIELHIVPNVFAWGKGHSFTHW